MPLNQHQPPPHHFSQSPTQRASHYPGHFQLSEPQRSHVQFQGQAQAFNHLITSGAHTNVGGVSSPNTTTPNTASGGTRKVLHKPLTRTGGSSSHGQATALKTTELTPAVRRKKCKVSDKFIPDKVAAILPESGLYSQLLELEGRVDATLYRKKIDMLESLENPLRFQKTLRIYVFNTFANQTPDTAEPASWSLMICGRILGRGTGPLESVMEQKSGVSYPKFSSFFKKVTVYLDQNLYPDNHVILWDSARSPALHEGFEIKRKGDKEFTAIIKLEMNYMPEKFKLSPALQEVLGIEVETRARVLVALWDLKLVSDDSTRDSEMERRSDFYNQTWTEYAVFRYLNLKHASGTDHSARK
ncbi:hypothetical protein K7X08_034977 [Anisodus acutangulus]|uniref:Uncharacterized protein n=1 Tax=Anisodus acutangulus TaxID=402998 RepID=A0A9Q1LJS7_9SOLA|nr:hypothetical protein K7X08_034977 [Anisodus acutangulus]